MEPINASKMPWYYRTDLRISKSIKLSNTIGLALFIDILNVFDRKNVINVYSKTGSAKYDGYPELGYYKYLASAYGSVFEELYRHMNYENSESYRHVLGKELF